MNIYSKHFDEVIWREPQLSTSEDQFLKFRKCVFAAVCEIDVPKIRLPTEAFYSMCTFFEMFVKGANFKTRVMAVRTYPKVAESAFQ